MRIVSALLVLTALGTLVDGSGPHGGLYPDTQEAAYPPTYWPKCFGSSHPSGANFVLCDGSVRNIPFSVDRTIFQYACMINDGKATTLP